VNPLLFSQLKQNGADIVHLPNESSASLSIASQADSKAVLVSKSYHRYQAGKSQLALMTGVWGGHNTANTKRVGYYDDSNGLFFELSDKF
jgi:hypothetical protein